MPADFMVSIHGDARKLVAQSARSKNFLPQQFHSLIGRHLFERLAVVGVETFLHDGSGRFRQRLEIV